MYVWCTILYHYYIITGDTSSAGWMGGVYTIHVCVVYVDNYSTFIVLLIICFKIPWFWVSTLYNKLRTFMKKYMDGNIILLIYVMYDSVWSLELS